MSEPKPTPVIPGWLSRCVIVLLGLQVALLWTHGSLLQRQHGDILAMREDIQALADSLDQDQDNWDANEAEAPRPARTILRRHHRAKVVRAALLRVADDAKDRADSEDQGLQSLKKDTDAVRQSEQEALAKAHLVQEQLSISENIRKADEKAKLDAATDHWRPWLWAASGLALLGVVARAVLRRRG